MTDPAQETGKRRGPSDQDLATAVPQATGAHHLRIGVFVLLGLLASVLVLYLATDPALFRGRYMVTTQVNDAGGLRRGDPVQMRGVNIGRVHRFAITDEGVVITLEIEGEWEIPADSRTQLVSNGLLGGRTVDVVPGRSQEAARGGQQLPGIGGGDLMADAQEITGEAQEVLVRIRSLLSAPTVESVQASARELETLLGQLNEVTESQKDELAQLTRRLNSAAAGLDDATSGPELKRALARADSAMLSLNATTTTLRNASSSLEAILARMERGEGTLGQLSVNDTLYQSITSALNSLDELLADLKENPGRYINLSVF